MVGQISKSMITFFLTPTHPAMGKPQAGKLPMEALYSHLKGNELGAKIKVCSGTRWVPDMHILRIATMLPRSSL